MKVETENWGPAGADERQILAQMIDHMPDFAQRGDSRHIAMICVLQSLLRQLATDFAQGRDGAAALAAIYSTVAIAASGSGVDIETLAQAMYDEATT